MPGKRIVFYTFGSLVHLFLMVLVLGQRRLRWFEWLLFWLLAALFMWNSGNLLSLNVGLHYGVGPNGFAVGSRALPFAGRGFWAPRALIVTRDHGRRRPAAGVLQDAARPRAPQPS